MADDDKDAQTKLGCRPCVFDAHCNNALLGWVEANNGLVLLEGHKVLLRRDYRSLNQVKLVSGGSSGFEPMYTGFVGPGMLTAIAVGEKYCAPAFPSILVAIRELAIGNPFGVLVIFLNHPLHKLSFMLACEKATRENIRLRTVIISDNCVSSDEDIQLCTLGGMQLKPGRKGMAGLALIIKIAGAMADQNRTLEEIACRCQELGSTDLSTLSINISPTLNDAVEPPMTLLEAVDNLSNLSSTSNSPRAQRKSLSNHQMSLDKLVSGQIETRDTLWPMAKSSSEALQPFTGILELAKTVFNYLIEGDPSSHNLFKEGNTPIVVLMNNYGVMPNHELNALLHEVIKLLKNRSFKIARIYVGPMVIAMNLNGFSFTVMRADEDILNCLDHPVVAPGWPIQVMFHGDPSTPLPVYIRGSTLQFDEEPKVIGPLLDDKRRESLFRAIEYACISLLSCEDQLNKMGSVFSNPLYGSQLKKGILMISEALYNNELKLHCPYALCLQLSIICANKFENNCGSYYAVFFEGAAQAFSKHLSQSEINPSMWTEALENGIKALEYYTELKRGERTMLDALYPMLEVMRTKPTEFILIAEAAEQGSLNSVNTRKKAHYVPDPLTYVVALWVRAAVEGLNSFKTNSIISQEVSDNSFISLV